MRAGWSSALRVMVYCWKRLRPNSTTNSKTQGFSCAGGSSIKLAAESCLDVPCCCLAAARWENEADIGRALSCCRQRWSAGEEQAPGLDGWAQFETARIVCSIRSCACACPAVSASFVKGWHSDNRRLADTPLQMAEMASQGHGYTHMVGGTSRIYGCKQAEICDSRLEAAREAREALKGTAGRLQSNVFATSPSTSTV